MRKELVNADTKIGAQDFMRMITNDWDSIGEAFEDNKAKRQAPIV